MYHDRDTVNEAASSYSADHSTERNANFLADCAATILERFASAKSASRASLEDLRVVGERLNEAKEALAETKGGFGKWAEAFPFDKTWRARLMKLATHWDEILEAVNALPEDRRKWSVDGVLAIFAASEKAKAAPEGGEGGGEGEGEGGEPKAKAKKETEAERLRRELAEAMAAIAALQAEVEALKGAKAKSKPHEEPKAKPEEPKASPGTVDAATKARARKVWGLYQRPGTEGEGTAARGRLEGMAAKCGMDFDTFIRACGLN